MREAALAQARNYIKHNKSFRQFETECNIPADKSGELWSVAALQLQRGEYTSLPYRVSWTIDVEANSPVEAAKEALKVMRDKESIATSFEVQATGSFEEPAAVDLIDLLFEGAIDGE